MKKRLSRGSLILRAAYATCLALATITHVLVDVRYGILLDGLAPLGYPLGVRMYWASLTLLDPLAALFLFFRPRAGLVLCVAIIVTDVLNNSWVRYHRREVDIGYVLQVVFLVFVLATVRYAWEGLPEATVSKPGVT